MKKRILSTVLALCMIISTIPALSLPASAAISGICGDNLTWTLDDTGTLTISGTLDSENPYGQTDLAMFTVTPGYNLSIGGAVYHEELLVAGNTLELYTEITNSGELTVDNYTVQVIDESGEVLATTYSDSALLPGETVDFTAYYPLGYETFVPHGITLKAVALGVTDFDESDNSCAVELNCENISLENMDYGIDADGNAVIYADIVNRGYSTAESITATLYKGSTDSDAIETVNVEGTLDTLELASVSFTVPNEDDAVYYIVLNQEGRNSDFVVLQSELAITHTLGDIDGNDEVDINDAVRLFQYSMLPDVYPIDYAGNVDFTKDGAVDINDAVRLF